MSREDARSQFTAELLRPVQSDEESSWAFVVLPMEVSEKLPRRGRTTVDGEIDGHRFSVTLEPDGQRSHWLKVSKKLQDEAGVAVGDVVTFDIKPVESEPEPEIPLDLEAALTGAPKAMCVWAETTTIARMDWIHWITSAKQSKTRAKRINDACDMLSSGKRRVCCFDPSGFYSKALSAPKIAEH